MTTNSNFPQQLKALSDRLDLTTKGYPELKRLSIIAMIVNGHILLSNVPGTGKTRFALALADGIEGAVFNRIQCTNDLLAQDITGFPHQDRATGTWSLRRGPLLADRHDRAVNILLVDELNRTTPKTQAAFLEAMEERQVSIDNNVISLPGLFFLIGTMNPVEEIGGLGTFPLPQAQVDRFLFRVNMSYVDLPDEVSMLGDVVLPGDANPHAGGQKPLTIEDIMTIRQEVRQLLKQATQSEQLKSYVARLVRAVRPGSAKSETDLELQRNFKKIHGAEAESLSKAIMLGASPRAAISLMIAGAGDAYLNGQSQVTDANIRAVAPHVMAHRILLSPLSLKSGLTSADVVNQTLSRVPVIAEK